MKPFELALLLQRAIRSNLNRSIIFVASLSHDLRYCNSI